MSTHRLRPYALLALLVIVLAGIPIRSAAPIAEDPPPNGGLGAGRNVNMVSGTRLPLGDPWVQRQNEPSVAVSSRNPMHLFAAANDYRTIDMSDPYNLRGIPGLSAVRDSWIGVFESFNYGESWITTMLPGFPQDTSIEGTTSPIHGFDTACDPIVRAGANGLLYLSGIAFNRSQQAGVVFISRYVDVNNRESVEVDTDPVSKLRQYVGPIEYMDTKLVDAGNSGQFIDMPNMAVDVPRNGAPYGNIYLSYTVFMGNTNQLVRSKIVLVRSTNGGVTWSNPVKLTESQHIIQRPVIVVDPSDSTGNTIYVAFRRFAFGTAPGGIVFVKSVDGGISFSKPADVATLLYPFDQGTSVKSFRTNSYPTLAVDGNGTAYIAWAQRPSLDGQARIVISYLMNGTMVWSTPRIVDPSAPLDGHQFMPTMTYGGGKLTLAWYDQRDDISLHHPNTKFIEDEPNAHRHTIDVRAAEGSPGTPPTFLASIPVSRYLYYIELDSNGEPKKSGDQVIVFQGEADFINYNLFELGTKPFHGDYMEIVSSPQILPPFATRSSSWTPNKASSEPTTSPVVWTDNRDVWPPGGNIWGDWTNYHPPTSEQDLVFQQENPCSPGGTAGMKNQNVYTSNLSHGVIVGSPGNTKQLDIQRSFVVLVKNTTEYQKALSLSLIPESGVGASFEQFTSKSSLDVIVLPYSSISCTVYVDAAAAVGKLFGSVEVAVSEGINLVGRVFLNPDSTNNLILDPMGGPLGNEVHTPHMSNPKVWKYDVGNPKEPNASVLSPRAQNPRAQNSGYVNPRAQNSSYENPRAQNPRAQNVGIQNENIVNNEMLNPRAQNPRVQNAALTDMVWTVSNEGNTTSTYSFNLVSDSEEIRNLFNSTDPPLIAQVLVYKVHTVPIDSECKLSQTHADELVVNVSNPRAQNPRVQNIAPTASRFAVSATSAAAADLGEDDITFNLAPGEEAEVILRVYDKDINDPYVFDSFIDDFAGETAADAANTGDTEPEWVTQPDVPWVSPLPAIVASPISMSFGSTGTQTLYLSLSGLSQGESLAYTLSADGKSGNVNWLTVSPVTPPGTLTGYPLGHIVAVDTTGLPAGSYVGWITVSVPEALNNPVRIPVYFNTNPNLVPEITLNVNNLPYGDGATFDFGSVYPGTTSDVTFRIGNDGSANLILGGKPIVMITGPDAAQFSMRQQPISPIQAGGYADFVIRFQPTTPGPKTAAISIANNDLSENPYDIVLQGAGAASALVAYYPFSGNADDESGSGNHGALRGYAAFTGDRFGNIPGAVGLNGTDAYVEVPDSASLDSNYPLTLSAWIYLNDNAKGGIVGQWGTGGLAGDAYVLYVQNTKLTTYVPRPGQQGHLEIFSNASLPTGQWIQVSMVSTGSAVSLYINGNLDKTEAVTVEQVDSDQTVKIGYENNFYGSPNYLNGGIDEVRIYKRTLSAAEIQALYSLEAGRVAYYPFNGNADDESGNQLHGTPAGAVSTTDAAGIPNRAYSFDGFNDAITVPGGSLLNITDRITLAAWIYPTATKTQEIVIRSPRTNNPPNPYELGLSQTGYVVFSLSLNGTRTEARKAGYDLNRWSLIVGTYDGATMRLYINGALVATNSVSGTIDTAPNDNYDYLVMGSRLQLTADTFQGVLDDIRVYNRVLSASEIQALYNAIR